MRIKNITCEGFPPFAPFDLNFPPVPEREPREPSRGEVQFLTGPNGTGKSRLLAALAAAFGHPGPLKERWGRHSIQELKLDVCDTTMRVKFGMGRFPEAANGFKGLAFAYAGSTYLINAKVSAMTAAQAPEPAERLAFQRKPDYSAKLAQALVNLKQDAAQDFMNRGGKALPLAELPRAERIITSLETKISQALGNDGAVGTFAFRAATRPAPSLQVDWNGRTLEFGQLPDGLRMVIGWLVDVAVMTDLLKPESKDPLSEPMLILLDEPETHLHPAWQRKIIPLAQELLPNAQMIIATHSPFVIMSVNEGWIHQLQPQADGSVTVAAPVPAKPGDSYIDVVREIMGVPERFDPESEGMMADFREAKALALDGDAAAETRAFQLLGNLALRGEELGWIARAEEQQLKRELTETVPVSA